MKTSINSVASAIFLKLAHKRKAKNPGKIQVKSMQAELYCPIDKLVDIYVWDWEYGLVKLEKHGENIATALEHTIQNYASDKRVFKFSFLGAISKETKTFDVFNYGDGVGNFEKWKEQNSSAFKN